MRNVVGVRTWGHHSWCAGRTRPLAHRELGRRRDSDAFTWLSKRIVCDLSGFEGGCCGIDQMLSLLFHPFLVVEFDVVFVFSTSAVGFSHARGVVSEVGIAVIAVVFGHFRLGYGGLWRYSGVVAVQH